MAYGLSSGHVTDDVTCHPKVLRGSTVGYPSDSLASCIVSSDLVVTVTKTTPWAIKKRYTFIFSITQTNIDRFS